MRIFCGYLRHLKLIIIMFRKLLLLCILMSICSTLFAQVGIGTSSPDPSSILDITATNKGLLIPRVALSSINNSIIDGKFKNATGLLIYNTNSSLSAGSGFYYWDGAIWNAMIGSGQNGASTSASYGEVYLTSDQTLPLTRYTNTDFPAATPGISSSDIILSDLGIQPTSGGVYRITYSITYKKNQSSGPDTIRFYITENTNRIARTEVTGALKNNEYVTVSVTKLLNLTAWQTYYLGINATQNPDANQSITLNSKQTNISIEKIK